MQCHSLTGNPYFWPERCTTKWLSPIFLWLHPPLSGTSILQSFFGWYTFRIGEYKAKDRGKIITQRTRFDI